MAEVGIGAAGLRHPVRPAWKARTAGTRAGTTPRPRRRARQKASKLAPLFALTLIIPVFFYVGPLRLAPFLLVLIAAFIPLCFVWVTGNAGRVRAPDLLILFSCLWGAIALFRAHGTDAVEPAGVLLLQTFGAYLMGRCLVRNKASCSAVFSVYFVMLLVLLPFAILETRNSVPYYLKLWSGVGLTYPDLLMESRMGLERVQVAFEHPILFGIFASSGFAVLFYNFRGVKRAVALLASTVAAILSVSTGAIVCLATQWGLILWGRTFRRSPKRWRNLGLAALAGYLFVDVLSNRTPFNVFVDYLTFNQGNAYNRILIWHYGTAEVARNPFFGIGMNEWTRPEWMSPSMDNFWLLIAVRYGLPALLTLALAFLLILFRVGRRQGLDDETALIRRGMIISLVGIFVAIGSVHLWNATFSWLMFFVGSLVWIMDKGEEPKSRKLALGGRAET